MVIRCQRRKYRPKVRARARESEPGREQVWATDLDQVMDQAPAEIWGPAISRSGAAVRADRLVMATPIMMVRGGMVSAAEAELFKERMCYLSLNRSTPKTRARIRS